MSIWRLKNRANWAGGLFLMVAAFEKRKDEKYAVRVARLHQREPSPKQSPFRRFYYESQDHLRQQLAVFVSAYLTAGLQCFAGPDQPPFAGAISQSP